MTTWVFRRAPVLVRFGRSAWTALIEELGHRGEGCREAGAFLLATTRGHQTVREIVYFDDLDPSCLRGGICFNGLAYSRLWDICEAQGTHVIADVHTHPGAWVAQSAIDARNPMIARAGHVALIVPHLATRQVVPRDIGVHQYLGTAGWTSWTGSAAATRVKVRRWP